MRFRGLFVVAVMFFLYGCTQQPTPPIAPTAVTLQPPQVYTQAVEPTATPAPTTTQPTPSATPTQAAGNQPTPTATESPTTQPTPSATPTTVAAQSSPTPGVEGCIDTAAFFGDVTIPDNTSFKQSTS